MSQSVGENHMRCAMRTAAYLLTIYSRLRIYASMNIETERMRAAADAASALLKALANRHRLLILCQLIGQDRSVGELAAFLGIRDSTVSQHLALMRRDGLVVARRDGQTIWYSISSDPARALLETLYRVYCGRPGTAAPRKPHDQNIAAGARRKLSQINDRG